MNLDCHPLLYDVYEQTFHERGSGGGADGINR